MAAAAHPVTPPPSLQSPPVPVAGLAAERALVPSPGHPERLAIGPHSTLAQLPVEVEVGVPVRDFRVRNLLALERGVIVASQWSHGEDLPLAAGHVQLAWTQFEVVENNLAARVTRPA